MDRNSLTFIATGKSGIGHLRRVTTIALALRRAQQGLELTLITNAAPAGIVRAELDAFDQILVRSRGEMLEALSDQPDVIVCDTVELPGIGAGAWPESADPARDSDAKARATPYPRRCLVPGDRAQSSGSLDAQRSCAFGTRSRRRGGSSVRQVLAAALTGRKALSSRPAGAEPRRPGTYFIPYLTG